MAADAAQAKLATLFAILPAARLVGGCVRDRLAGQPVADYDLATPDAPDVVITRLTNAGVKAIPTGLAHGTVTAVLAGHPYEVTTLRRDVVTNGRHAEVVWTDDWQVDAARRDFTINAMSESPDGTLHDYFGGLADLRAGRVRFVGDAAERVREDYLRILRFFRFQARYGRGEPDPAAVAAIEAGLDGLHRLSPERIWSELKRILLAPDPDGAIGLMASLGVMERIVPEGFAARGLAGLPVDPVLRMAALLAGDPAAFATRLRLSTAEAQRLKDLQGPVFDGDDDALRQALADTPADILVGRSWIAGQDADSRTRLSALARPVFPLAGRDVVAAGVPPGPLVGVILAGVRQWWLRNGCRPDEAACRAELARSAAG